MQKICSLISYFAVAFRYPLAVFFSPGVGFGDLCQPALLFGEPFVCLTIVPGIVHLLAIGKAREMLQPNVNTDGGSRVSLYFA